MIVPKFIVREEQNDIGAQIRVQQIANGFVIRGCAQPVFCKTTEEMAEAVKQGLIAAFEDPKIKTLSQIHG
jgi:hypothetical protein